MLLPTYHGQRGNPVICEYGLRQTILDGGGRLSLRQLIDENPELVYRYEADTDHVVFDVDTLADYEALLARLRKRDALTGSSAALHGKSRAAG